MALPHAAIYIIAYLGRVVYVGKAQDGVEARLAGHMTAPSRLGSWLRRVDDWENVRLDVLGAHDDDWLRRAEEACIRRFRPLLNTQLL